MLVPTTQVTGGGSGGDSGDGGADAVHSVNAFGHPSNSPPHHTQHHHVKKKKSKEHKVKKQPSLIDPEQLNAGKQALKELLKERKTKKKEKTTLDSILRLYTTILAGLMIIGGLFTLLFLVPMTIDPALATLTYEFHPKPALCMTTFADWVAGQASINWCSCTMGCTSDIFNCSQIVVVYRKCFMTNNNNHSAGVNSPSSLPSPSSSSSSKAKGSRGSCSVSSNTTTTSPSDMTDFSDPGHWDVLNASLYINVKGCGYPPEVNCTNFFDRYGVPGRRFWCYYSKMDPYLVMPDYDRQEAEMKLIKSLGWTIGAQVVGILIIMLLHCPYVAFCKNLCRRRKTQQRPKNAHLGGVVNHGATSSMTSLVSAWKDKDKPRQPVFQRDWYDVHT